MSLSDLHPIRQLRQTQARLFDAIRPQADSKRVLLYSMDPWQLGIFEQFLHLALQLKGHEPKSIYYDGLLPLTAWENVANPPPPLSVLKDRFAFIYDCFGIQPAGISQYLDHARALRTAEKIVAAAADADLAALSHRGIPIGRIAQRDLCQYTLGCFEPRTSDEIARYRAHLIHAVMSVDLAHAIHDVETPDIVVLVNGKSVMYSYMYEVCLARKVQVTTWEEGMYFDTSIILANNERAIDFPVSNVDWQATQQAHISTIEINRVSDHFEKWRNQTATSYAYYDDEIRDIDRILRELSIEADHRVVSLFANIVWDTNALEKDDTFHGMMDWIFSTIEVLAGRRNDVLVIRAHPGETKWSFQTRTPVRSLIEARYGGLPRHVRVVDGRSEISSYELARRSDRCAVYTSTLGIELSLAGLQPLVCGVPYYSRKGFTNDIHSREEYRRLLLREVSPRQADPILLKKFMHLVLFRLLKQPEFFVGIHGSPQQPRIRIDSFEGWPESMPIFNRIVNSILNNSSFVSPLGRPPRVPAMASA